MARAASTSGSTGINSLNWMVNLAVWGWSNSLRLNHGQYLLTLRLLKNQDYPWLFINIASNLIIASYWKSPFKFWKTMHHRPSSSLFLPGPSPPHAWSSARQWDWHLPRWPNNRLPRTMSHCAGRPACLRCPHSRSHSAQCARSKSLDKTSGDQININLP